MKNPVSKSTRHHPREQQCSREGVKQAWSRLDSEQTCKYPSGGIHLRQTCKCLRVKGYLDGGVRLKEKFM